MTKNFFQLSPTLIFVNYFLCVFKLGWLNRGPLTKNIWAQSAPPPHKVKLKSAQHCGESKELDFLCPRDYAWYKPKPMV